MSPRLKITKGLEALFASSRSSINSPSDALVCFTHAFLTSNHFSCVGVSDRDVSNTDLLPAGWSDSQDVYLLKYFNESEADNFTLKVLVIEGVMTVQLLRRSDECVTSTNIKITNFTHENVADFSGTFKDLRDLEVQLDSDLLQPLMSGSQPPPPRRDPPPQRTTYDPDPLRIGHGSHPARGGHLEPDDPFAVGRGDLDPIHAGVGGGMIMDPFRHGPHRDPNAGLPPGARLPPGSVPPGARFDPFGPPGIGGGPGAPGGPSRFGPTPDHMRPPGYDDMFM